MSAKLKSMLLGFLLLAIFAPVVTAKEFRDCKGCPLMVEIPGKDYAIGKYLVTFDEWDACVRAGGCSGFKPDDSGWGRGKRPVINVTWNVVQEYLKWLSKKTGKTYRLPNEIEWEFACYGGMKTTYCGGNDLDSVAWHGSGDNMDANSHSQSHPVGEKKPNGYGLYDMTGNVYELMNDCESSCNSHVTRGGSWYDFPKDLVATARNRVGANSYDNCIGFRVVRVKR